jgi:SAM-dependent methyltransferase
MNNNACAGQHSTITGADHPQSAKRESRKASNEQRPSGQCLICGSLRHRIVFREFDIDILQCSGCHHVFSSFAADPHYDGFWGAEVADEEHIYWRKARNGMYQEFQTKFLASGSGRLLDMGCGLGFFVKTVAELENWEAYGCEISPAAVRYAREKLNLKNIFCSRLEDVELPPHSFDVITMWDVIDHILHPDPLFRRCHTLLRDGGMFFLRTPNVTVQLLRARINKLTRGMRPNVDYLQARDHAHHYSMSSIRKLLERNGFTRIQFVHLHPVQDPDGKILVRGAKSIAFRLVRALATFSKEHLNFDNLFVVAQKGQ